MIFINDTIYFSSDNSEIIANQVQNISDKHEESGSEDTVRKTVSAVTEKVLGIPYDKKKNSDLILSASSTSSSSDTSTSDSDTDDSSGKYS